MMYRPVNRSAIPAALTEQPQWVCWTEAYRDGKQTKIPINPDSGAYASVNDSATWTDFDTAYRYHRDTDGIAGIGYVFTQDGPYVGADLDDCRDPGTGEIQDWARDIIETLDSYTEVSPSGTGVHVIATGTLPDGRNRHGDIELYDRDRYFTVTGAHLDLTPTTVYERSAALAQVHDAYLAAQDADETPSTTPADSNATLTDAEVIERAANAENGDKFLRLWSGDTSGYPSHSEADQALCNILAFWTGGDRRRIEQLFNQSGLVRDKWRERPDYRERTIENAIEDCTDYYAGN